MKKTANRFYELLRRATPKYVPSKHGKDDKKENGDYSGKRTRQRKFVNTSD